MKKTDILIIGSGNAALCAGISALENSLKVTIIEKASKKEWGGNSRYTAGAMRFAFESFDDLKPLIRDLNDERLQKTNFGSYPKSKFLSDLEYFNEGLPITELQQFLVDESLSTVQWLGSHNVKFDPSYARQSFLKDGIHTFWGGLALDVEGEGDGLVQAELKEFLRLGGEIIYGCEAIELLVSDNQAIEGVLCKYRRQTIRFESKAVILGCGGFEANKKLREKYLGKKWGAAKVRGTRHNLGKGLEMAVKIGAATNGFFGGCHAVPMDKEMPEYGNLNLPFNDRKHYRKISYLFGIMLNAKGKRFVDEGFDMRNYTYAQFGKAVLEQEGNVAWQIFDAAVFPYLYQEYKVSYATYFESDTLEGLVQQLEGIDKNAAMETINEYNKAASKNATIPFDPTKKDGKSTVTLPLNKTNWANELKTPPFRAYPVTSGITFTYGGVKVDKKAQVLNEKDKPISGLFACGEMVGGIFFHGYPGGSGLTSGALFGKNAGKSAAIYCNKR